MSFLHGRKAWAVSALILFLALSGVNARVNASDLLDLCNIQENISSPGFCTKSACKWPWEIFELKITKTWCTTNDAQYTEDDFVTVSLDVCLSDPTLDHALAVFHMSPICINTDAQWYPGRGVLYLETHSDFSILHVQARGIIKLREPEEAFCSGLQRCQKDYCYMDLFHFYEDVRVWMDIGTIGQQDIYGPITYTLPQCNAGCNAKSPACHVGATTPYYDMTIHMVQVKRGDSFILEFNHYECTGVPEVDDQSSCGDNTVDSRVFLIDGGSKGQGSATGNVLNVLKAINHVVISGVDQAWKIDYVIATHSDSDHIGGLNDLLIADSHHQEYFRRPSSTDTGNTFFIHDNPYDSALRMAIGVETSTAGASSCAKLYSPEGKPRNLSAQAYRSAVLSARQSIVYAEFLTGLTYDYSQGYKLAWDSTSNYQSFLTTYNDDLNLPPLIVKNLGAPKGSLADALSNPLFCGKGGPPNKQTSKAILSNMVSTITEFTWGKSKLLFTGDANMQEFSYSANVPFQQHYRFLKVPHHCSPDSMTPDGSDYYYLTADFYLISGKTQGYILQPGAECLNAIIKKRVNRARDLGVSWRPAQIFLTNYDSPSTQISSKNPLDVTIKKLDPAEFNYRLYVLKDTPEEGVFQISSATGEVLVNLNDFNDLTAGFFPGLPNTFILANQTYYPGYVKFPY